MNRLHRTTVGLLGVALLALAPLEARGQVAVQRTGSENPVKEIAMSTVYGGLAGLVLGSAVALVAESNEGDTVKWFFVGGTFFGFGYGVYHVSTRPEPHAALTIGEDGLRAAVPTPAFRMISAPPGWTEPGGGQDVSLSLRFLDVRF